MTWKTKGKIGCHFPDRTLLNPNFDVTRVVYSQDGVVANAKEIEKVYYISPAAAEAIAAKSTHEERMAELAKWLVWQRYWEEAKHLVAGTLTVCIEIDLTDANADVPLSSFAIFTADSESSTTVNAGVLHESGIVVYLANVDNIDYNTSEKYGLTGERRIVQSINNVVLKKGLKYYIQYTNSNNTFKPAYFAEGSGHYLNWSHGSLQQKSVANLNSAAKYLGVVSNVATWLAADENDFMIANGINGLNTSDAYIRNNVCNGAALIGKSGESLPPVEKDKLLSLDTGDGFMYIGTNVSESGVDIFVNTNIYEKTNTLVNTNYKGMKSTLNAMLSLNVGEYCVYTGENDYGTSPQMIYNYVYRKKKNIVVNVNYTCSHDGTQLETAYIVDASCDPTTNKNVEVNGSWWYVYRKGAVYTLKSDYHAVDLNKSGDTINGYDPANVSTLAANTIIYFYTGGSCPLVGNYVNAGVYFWNGSSLAEIGQSTLDTYFSVTTLSDMIEVINLTGVATSLGSVSVLTKTHYDSSYISNNLRGETVQTGTRYYIELNGSEWNNEV